MSIILTNTSNLPGREVIKHLGLVQGNTVRTKHIGRDIAAGFKNLVGGELRGYTELLGEAREECTSRMIADAEKLGANAIISVRYGTSSVANGASELFVYGTAVVVS